MKNRNVALVEVNSDLTNVLTSINVPLVMVGKDLKIRRFTQAIAPMLNLMDSDIGRSLSDLKSNIDAPNLPELLQRVISGGAPLGREIQDSRGRWHSLQALPYRTPDNNTDGALIVLLDIHAVKVGRDYAEAVIETVRQPFLILAKDFRVIRANEAFYETFKISRVEIEYHHPLYDLGNGQWNIPELREALEKILPHRQEFRNFEIDHTFKGIGRKILCC